MTRTTRALRPRVAFALAFALAGSAAAADEAQSARAIYEWTDERGVTHYTDDRELVPEPFLGSVRIAELSGDGSFQRAIERRVTAPPAAHALEEVIANTTEAQWRAEAARLDAVIAELAPLAKKCKGDHRNDSPGDGSRKRQEELAEAEACAEARAGLASARAEREAFGELAHRAGVPPGWVRESD